MENNLRLIKKVTYKGPTKKAPTDYSYWKSKSYEERISAVEFLREAYYDKVTPRLQRVYRVVKRSKS